MIKDLFPPELQALFIISGFTALVPYAISTILGISLISSFIGGASTAIGLLLLSPLVSAFHCYCLNKSDDLTYNTHLKLMVGSVFKAYKTAHGKELNINDFEIAVYIDDKPNAFATRKYYGFSLYTKPVIYASSGIMEKLKNNPEALKGVIAHELGHVVGKHAILQCLSHTLEIVSRQVLKAVKTQLFDKRKPPKDTKSKQNSEINVPLIGLAVTCKAFELLGVSFLSRRYEFSADNFAVSLGFGTGLKEGLISINKNAEKKLRNDHWMITKIYNMVTESFSTHPNLKNRIENINMQMDRKRFDNEKETNIIGSIKWSISNFLDRNLVSYFTAGQPLKDSNHFILNKNHPTQIY